MLRAATGLILSLTVCLSLTVPSYGADSAPAYVAKAVADASRPDTDRERDANRKPAETLAFAGIKPGQRVAELIPGRGYYTRLLSKIVGPKGKVYALGIPPRPNAPPDAPNPNAALQALAQEPGYSNVTVLTFGPDGPGLGVSEPVDVVWTSDNYHDFHNRPNADMAAFNKRVFEALKPGGLFIVIDHAAASGTGVNDTRTLHRIDPEAAKSEILAAGFKLVGTSTVLANPQDPHNVPVSDASIRGKTDQFAMKFVKPK